MGHIELKKIKHDRISLNLIGQKDCFPAPSNVTDCNATLPNSGSIICTRHQEPHFYTACLIRLSFLVAVADYDGYVPKMNISISNMAITPNIRSTQNRSADPCFVIFETCSLPLVSTFEASEIELDASNMNLTACMTSNVHLEANAMMSLSCVSHSLVSLLPGDA
jgi:hypothetical protein